jgi:hypothetical protein
MTGNQADPRFHRDLGYRRATSVTVGLAAASVAASFVVAGAAWAATQEARENHASNPDGSVPATDDSGANPGGATAPQGQPNGTTSQPRPSRNSNPGSLWPGVTGGGGPPQVSSGGS